MTSRRPRLEAFLAGATVFVVSAVALTVTERSASDALVQQARVDLVGFARMAAASMTAQQHQDLLAMGRVGSSAYRAVSEPLLRLRGAVPEIYYAYTLVRAPDGLHFGVDSSAFIKNPGDDTPVAQLRQPYPDAPPAALRAFRTGQAQASRSTYTDAWGTFLSAYAPFPPDGPTVAGVVGVDLSLADLQSRLYPLRLALAMALFASAGASILVGYRRFRAVSSRLYQLEELEQGRILAEQAAAAAMAANRAKSTFLSTLGHELRTPLNGILGMTAHVLAGELAPETRECIETAQTSAEALLSALNDILTFSSLEAGELRLAPRSVPLRPFLEEILAGLAEQARSKGLELRLLPPAGLDSIWTGPNGIPRCLHTDPDHLRRVLGHLLGNAIKFSSRGEVVVTVSRVPGPDMGDDLLELAVSDQGPALPSPRLDELFQPFVQADGSNTRRHGGLGLGLVIVQRLVTALGGRIAVESEPGVGSTFRVSLPGLEPLSSPVPLPTEASGPEPVQVAEAAGEDPRRSDGRAALSVLVAEDSAVNRKVCELMLSRLGHQVTFAVDGLEAVRLQESLDPDLIIMDLQMPHLDGFGATEQIRRHCADPGHPWIVALTAGGQPSDREHALAAGMNDFLTKPLRLQALQDALSRAEQARQGNQGASLKSGSRFSRKALRPS